MKIFVAKSSGFCFGVKRAINLAKECAEETLGPIYTLGPIIHNPQVVQRLESSSGIRAKDSIDDIGAGTVIVRSHGIRREEHEKAVEKGLNVVDATCPFVKKAQELVGELARQGYAVIVAGEKEHPEVRGLISYGAGAVKIRVASTIAEIKDMPRKKKIGIIAQTTLPIERLEDIVCFCLGRAAEVKVFNTICNATSIRQEESALLAKKVGRMFIVGGRNSANTRRLFEICRAIQPMTFHIEVAGEIKPEWIEGADSVGVTSGASTPDWIIDEVVMRIKGLSGDSDEKCAG